MKYILILLSFIPTTALAQSPWYYGSGAAVNLENAIQYKNGVKNITGALNPTVTAVNAPAGSLYMSTLTSILYVKQDAGSTTNWIALSSTSGTPNTFAGYDGSGNLYSLPEWDYVPYVAGVDVISTTDGTSQTNLTKINFQTTLGDGVSGDADTFKTLALSSNIDANYVLDNYTGFSENITIDASATVDNYAGVNIGATGNITGLAQPLYINRQGDSDGITAIGVNHIGDVANQFQGFRIDNAGTMAGMYGLSIVNQSDSTGQIELANLTNSGDVTNNQNLIGINLYNNATTIEGSITGYNLSNETDGSSGVTLFQGNNSGDSGNFTGVSLTNTGVITTNMKGLDFQDSSNSPAANIIGINANITGTYDSVQGLKVDVSAATDDGGDRKVAIEATGGTFSAVVPFTTVSSLPSVVDGGHQLITAFTVNSGSPITDTSVLANNFSGLATFNDNYDGDPFYNLGYAMVGFVGQVGVASTKTVEKVSMAIGGASIPVSSTGGTIEQLMMFDARGALSAGGSIVIDDLFGFRAETGMCTLATGCWGLSVEDTSADNFIAKSLQIGGTQVPLSAGDALVASGRVLAESASFAPVQATRTTALTNIPRSAIRVGAETSNNMVDEFGSLITFGVEDDTSGPLSIGEIGAVRMGADNTGDLVFRPYTTGTANERMRITAAGLVNIPGLTASQFVKTDASKNLVSSASIDLTTDVTGILPIANGGTGSSTLAGANILVKSGSYTDNCAVTSDGTTNLLQCNSPLIFSDAGGISGATQIDVDNLRLDGNTISSTDTNGNILLAPNGTGNVGVGSSSSPTVKLVVSSQSGVTSATTPTGVVAQVSGTDATTSRILLDAYGASPLMTFRQAGGTQASPSASSSAAALGGIAIFGYDGSAYQGAAAQLDFVPSETWSGSGRGNYMRIRNTSTGSTTLTERYRLHDDGLITQIQPAATSKSAAATLTAAELRTRIIQYTGSAANLTMPTGTDLQTTIGGALADMSFDFDVINTGSGAATLVTNTGITIVGNAIVAAGDSAGFRARRSGSNAFTIYRVNSGSSTISAKVATITDVKSSGTDGGTCTSGSFQTRTLNTLSDPSGIVTSLASNQFTLPAGTYQITATAPAYKTGEHKAKLRNITDSTDDIIGTSEFSATGDDTGTSSSVVGVVTIAGSKTFEIQHRCGTTSTTNGFGRASSFSVSEVYTTVAIEKL